jgi:hypothetical protein
MRDNENSGQTFPKVARSGKVASVEGAAPVKKGDECALTLMATGRRGLACYVSVRCGTVTLYGGSTGAFLRCAFTSGKAPRKVEDARGSGEDGTPRFALDLDKKTLVVSDAPSAPPKGKAPPKTKAPAAAKTPSFRVEVTLGG